MRRLYKKQRVESEFEKNIIPAEEASYGLDSPNDRKIYIKKKKTKLVIVIKDL